MSNRNGGSSRKPLVPRQRRQTSRTVLAGPGIKDVVKARGAGVGKRPEQVRVHHRENGDVESNADGQHADGERSKPAGLPERSSGDLQVGSH